MAGREIHIEDGILWIERSCHIWHEAGVRIMAFKVACLIGRPGLPDVDHLRARQKKFLINWVRSGRVGPILAGFGNYSSQPQILEEVPSLS